jgi:hypothetical protein
MSNEKHNCQSCGMPVEAGPYCQYCADENGKLHSFNETVVRMSQFMKRQTPGLSDEKATEMTMDHMAKMPAWRDHPRITARIKG